MASDMRSWYVGGLKPPTRQPFRLLWPRLNRLLMGPWYAHTESPPVRPDRPGDTRPGAVPPRVVFASVALVVHGNRARDPGNRRPRRRRTVRDRRSGPSGWASERRRLGARLASCYLYLNRLITGEKWWRLAPTRHNKLKNGVGDLRTRTSNF